MKWNMNKGKDEDEKDDEFFLKDWSITEEAKG